MAKNEMGELLGWGIAGIGVWLAGGLFGWWSSPLSSVASTTPVTGTTPVTSTTPTPTVVLAGPVTPTINNALQANVSINGSITNLAVIPGGDAYNSDGQDVTATLAALGVTPAQVYALMQAAYAIQPAATSTTTATTSPAATTSTTTRPSTITGTSTINRPVVNNPVAPVRKPIIAIGKRGVSGPMVFASQRNYVRRGSAF